VQCHSDGCDVDGYESDRGHVHGLPCVDALADADDFGMIRVRALDLRTQWTVMLEVPHVRVVDPELEVVVEKTKTLALVPEVAAEKTMNPL